MSTIYDDQDTRTKADDDELRRITGIDPAEEKKMEDSAVHDGGVAGNTEQKGLKDLSKDNKGSEKDKSNQDGSSLYTGDEEPGNRSLRSRIVNRKSAMGAGAAGLLVGGSFGVFTVLSGPAQVIQLAQLLNVNFEVGRNSSESRIGRMYEFYRTRNDPSKRNVSYTMEIVSSKYIRQLDAQGIKLNYDTPSGRQSSRLQSISLDESNPNSSRIIENLRNKGYTVDGGNINVRQFDIGERRDILKLAVDTPSKGTASNAIKKRILSARAGVGFHVLGDRRRPVTERLIDWRTERKVERSEDVKTGIDATDGRNLTGTEAEGENGETVRVNDDIANEANNGIQEAELVSDLAERNSLADRFKNTITRASGPAAAASAVIGSLCVARSIGNEIPAYQQANIILPMVRMSMNAISIGSQVQSGQDISLDELGAFTDDFYDEETQSSIWGAAAIQATQGKEVTGPDSEVKPSGVGEKPQLFDIVDQIPLLSTACGIQDGFGNFVRSIPLVGDVVNVFDSAVEGSINLALGPFGLSIGELMERLIAFLSGDLVDTFAKGAKLGNYQAIGGRLAANETEIASGGVALSDRQASILNEQFRQEYALKQKNKSFFARVLDLEDSGSLISKTIVQNPDIASIPSIAKSIAVLPSKLFASLGNSTGRLMPMAGAQTFTPSYDFGVPQYGFGADELDDTNYANPYDNADIVEGPGGSNLRTLNERWGDCFASRIDPDQNYNLITSDSVNYFTDEYREECSPPARGTQDYVTFKRYRFYLLDSITAKTLACYEGLDEAACTQLGFNQSLAATTTASPATGNAAQYIPDCAANGGNAAIACTAINELLGVPYSREQRAAPTTPDPVPFLDCSAFTGMAVYRTFGVNLGGIASVQYRRDPNFQNINVQDIQPGDFVGRGTVATGAGGNGHIGIVVSYNRATGALVTAETDGRSNPSRIVTNKGLRIDNLGTYEWAVRYIGPRNSPVTQL